MLVEGQDYVVGLQPTTRMPHDWLRMVSRVFATFDETQLKESITAYITGLNVSVVSQSSNSVTLKISEGSGFVDDQFIGILQAQYKTVQKNQFIVGNPYYLVLRYNWVNQDPPTVPDLFITTEELWDESSMLRLAILTKDAQNIIQVDNSIKIQWNQKIVDKLIYNPGHLISDEVDYGLPKLNKNGVLDVVHEIDFHANFNSTDVLAHLTADPNHPGTLYIDGYRILTSTTQYPTCPTFQSMLESSFESDINYLYVDKDGDLDSDGLSKSTATSSLYRAIQLCEKEKENVIILLSDIEYTNKVKDKNNVEVELSLNIQDKRITIVSEENKDYYINIDFKSQRNSSAIFAVINLDRSIINFQVGVNCKHEDITRPVSLVKITNDSIVTFQKDINLKSDNLSLATLKKGTLYLEPDTKNQLTPLNIKVKSKLKEDQLEYPLVILEKNSVGNAIGCEVETVKLNNKELNPIFRKNIQGIVQNNGIPFNLQSNFII